MTKQSYNDGDDTLKPDEILNSELVRNMREKHAHLTHIAEYEEKDLWETIPS